MNRRCGPRILSLLFAALFLLSACAGGGNTPSDTAGTQPPGETDAAPDAVSGTEDAAPYHDSVPALDFGGDTLTFCVQKWVAYEMNVEESTGETTNDAIYDRNRMMENRFRVVIDEIAVDDPGHDKQLEFIRDSLIAGDNGFDVAAVLVYKAGDLVLENWFMPWETVPYVELDNPWWVAKINDAFTVRDTLYTAVSDLCVTSMQFTYAYLFNQKLATDYHVENLYDAVDEGRWTLDYLYGLTKDLYADTNGNGTRDEEDTYGLLTDLNTSLNCYFSTSDQPIIGVTDDGLKVMLDTEKALGIYEKVNRIFNESGGVFSISHGQKGYVYDDKYRLFKSDSFLLMPVRLYALYDELSDMTSDFGIVPFPKYDEAQKQYLSSSLDNYSVLCVPASVEDAGMVGALIEALSCESKNSVMPAFYETALQHRYSRDSRSAKMLDIIMDGRTYDLCVLYTSAAGGIKNFMSIGIRDQKSFASFYAANENTYEKAARELYDKLSALGNPAAADTENQ